MRSFGCWRTLASAAAFLALGSYVTTARKHGMNPLVVLHQLFEGRPWLPARAGI
jgi:transposase